MVGDDDRESCLPYSAVTAIDLPCPPCSISSAIRRWLKSPASTAGVPAVSQARECEPFRLDERPAGAGHDRGGGGGWAAEVRRHHCRGDGRQYRPWTCPGRRAQRLSHRSGRARQDVAGEDPARARDGRGSESSRARMSARATPITTRTWPRRSRAHAGRESTSISSPIPPIRARMRPRTGPEILRQMDGDVDAVVVGVGSGGTLTGIGRCMRARRRKRDDPCRSGGLGAGALSRDRQDGRGRKLGGGRHRRGFRAAECDLSLVKKAYRSPTRKASRLRAIFCGRKASLPAPPPARCLRRRCAIAASRRRRSASSASSAIPARNISPKCSTMPSWRRRVGRAARARHRARRCHQSLRRRRPRSWSAGRHSAHRVCPHARDRRVAAAGDRGRSGGRPGRRERHAGACSPTPRGRRCSSRRSRTSWCRGSTLSRPTRRSPISCRCFARTSCHRHGRRPLPRPRDPHRPHQPFPDHAA